MVRKEKGREERARREVEQWTMAFLLFDQGNHVTIEIHANELGGELGGARPGPSQFLFFPHPFEGRSRRKKRGNKKNWDGSYCK